MSKYISYLKYFIIFICFVLSCIFLIVFLLEFYDLINRCYSINRFSVSVLNCIQAFSYEILKTSLNFEEGGEIAKNLEQIYNYSLNQLNLIIKEEFAQVRWRRPVPDVWFKLDQLKEYIVAE